MVALGILTGTWLAAHYAQRFGVSKDEVVSLATRLVIAGVVGARLTWVLTHTSSIDSPLDVIAVWKGGLQFSGGFILAVLVALPTFRRWSSRVKWQMGDVLALGLTFGLAVGRIGCYAVGEHFGKTTTFFLGVHYLGGDTREPVAVGQTIHNTALYELIHLLFLGVLLWWVLYKRKPVVTPGVGIGIFALWYGVARFGTDFLRAYDHTVFGLTGAQYMCAGLVPVGIWILVRTKVRRRRWDAGDEAGPAEGKASLAPVS